MRPEILDAVRGLRVHEPSLGVKPLVVKLRDQHPDLNAGSKEVRDALQTLAAESHAVTPPAATEGSAPSQDLDQLNEAAIHSSVDLDRLNQAAILAGVRAGEVGVCSKLLETNRMTQRLARVDRYVPFVSRLVAACMSHFVSLRVVEEQVQPCAVPPITILRILKNVLVSTMMIRPNEQNGILARVRRAVADAVGPLLNAMSAPQRTVWGNGELWFSCMTAVPELLWNVLLDKANVPVLRGYGNSTSVCLVAAAFFDPAMVQSDHEKQFISEGAELDVGLWRHGSLEALRLFAMDASHELNYKLATMAVLTSDGSARFATAVLTHLLPTVCLTSGSSEAEKEEDACNLNSLAFIFERTHRARIHCGDDSLHDDESERPALIQLGEFCQAHLSNPGCQRDLLLMLRTALSDEYSSECSDDWPSAPADWRVAALVGVIEVALEAAVQDNSTRDVHALVCGLIGAITSSSTQPQTRRRLRQQLPALQELLRTKVSKPTLVTMVGDASFKQQWEKRRQFRVELHEQLAALVANVASTTAAARREIKQLVACSRCRKPATGLRCGRCGTNYCSKECQEDDWLNGGHKGVCKIRRSVGPGPDANPMISQLGMRLFEEREPALLLQAAMQHLQPQEQVVLLKYEGSRRMSLLTTSVQQARAVASDWTDPKVADHVLQLYERNRAAGDWTIFIYGSDGAVSVTTAPEKDMAKQLASVTELNKRPIELYRNASDRDKQKFLDALCNGSTEVQFEGAVGGWTAEV